MIRPIDQNPTDPDPKPPAKSGRGKKGTNQSVAERTFVVAQMLSKRLHKFEIKRYLKAQYGLGPRQAETYIARARGYLLERSKRSRDEWIAEALATYENVVRDPEATNGERMAACDGICRLLGLNAPTKIAPTTPDGEKPYQPLDVSILTDEELEVLHRARIRLTQQVGQAAEKELGKRANLN